ncbi:hypothetical protein N665_0024s0007 [Sinapis alba]|nr:hypothetical protein N665_0024s0007 [Sinapis alba]
MQSEFKDSLKDVCIEVEHTQPSPSNLSPSKPSTSKQSTSKLSPTKPSTSKPSPRRSKRGSSLYYVSEESWNIFTEWSINPVPLQIGPICFNLTVASRIVCAGKWLGNEMDAAYNKFAVDKKGYQLPEFLLSYGRGKLPSHGRTDQVWGVDVDHLYFPLFINGNHCFLYTWRCHLLGLDLSLVDDEIIQNCRQKIGVELWEAAHDPVLAQVVKQYVPSPWETCEVFDLAED